MRKQQIEGNATGTTDSLGGEEERLDEDRDDEEIPLSQQHRRPASSVEAKNQVELSPSHCIARKRGFDGSCTRRDQVIARAALRQLQPGFHVSPAPLSEIPRTDEIESNSCISTGTRKGYSITNCDPFGKVYGKRQSSRCSIGRTPLIPVREYEIADGATSIVEMLFCTSLVALVGAGERPASSTRRLQIVNTKRQSTICELTFPTTILAVKLNRRRLVVVLEQRIYLYDISNMKLLHEIETNLNSNGTSLARFITVDC